MDNIINTSCHDNPGENLLLFKHVGCAVVAATATFWVRESVFNMVMLGRWLLNTHDLFGIILYVHKKIGT